MRPIDHIARIVFVAITVAGCSSTAPASTGPSASPTPTPAPSVEIPPDATIVELFVPEDRVSVFQIDGAVVASITVKPGVPYAFKIANPGQWDHNFFIGVAEDLAGREYTRLHGVHLWSAGERVIVYTFKPGEKIQFACTVAGHYGNMHGDFIIEP
jgi:hypothetical protein